MAQSALNSTYDNDTASLFRADALRLGTTIPLAPGLKGAEATNDEKFDPSEYDSSAPPTPGQPRKRKLSADEDALAKKSGYQITDERDINGAQNQNGSSGGSGGASAKAQAEMLQRAASTGSVLDRIGNTAKSWFRSAKNFAGDCFDRVTGFVSDTYENVAKTISEYVGKPLANAWSSAKETFSEYVGQPLSNLASKAGNFASSAWEGTKNTFSEYVAQPASSAWEGTKSTFSEYVGTPVSNMASGASEMASNAWSSTKSFFGYGSEATPAQPEQTAAAKVETPVERPAAQAQTLAGEQNNPSAGFSLGSAFSSAVDNVSNALGLGNAPAAPRTTPTLTPLAMQ